MSKSWPKQILFVNCTLTVFFEEPFWVGIFERGEAAGYSVAKITFGTEPTDIQIYQFILQNYSQLEFSHPSRLKIQPSKPKNFKRAQRDARGAVTKLNMTKAQNELRLELEQKKKVRKQISKTEREEEKNRKFCLRQQQKKQKARGH